MKTDWVYLRKCEQGCVPARPVEITEVFTLFLRCCERPFVFAGEMHEPWEMVYVRKGEASITADDKVYTLSPGSLIFHKPMEFHQIHAKNPGLEILVSSFKMFGDRAKEFQNAVFHLSDAEKEDMEDLIERCTTLNGGCYGDSGDWDCRPFWQANPLAFYSCINCLEGIFCSMLMRAPNRKQPKQTADCALFKKIISILEECIHTDITIQDVAERCGVSASGVKTCFSRHAGCGIHKYFLKIKMRTAIQMIRQGCAVSEVSDTLGFNNPNYFSYVFRRETGKRPTDFRLK